jgi:small subunit ribosomal protein S20
MRYTLLLKGGDFVPNIKSVKKDVIKSRKNHLRNIAAKSAMKTFIKKARTAIDTAVNTPTTAEAIRLAVKAIDKTAERSIIHKNQAARRKSRLMKRANKAAAQAAA